MEYQVKNMTEYWYSRQLKWGMCGRTGYNKVCIFRSVDWNPVELKTELV